MLTIMERFDLEDRVAVVTGASSGLGRRAAEVLHAAGASVVVVARREGRLDQLCEALGSRCLAVPADVTDPAVSDRIVAATLAQFGRVDLLVNVAGVADEDTAFREGEDRFAWVIDVNLTSVFVLSTRVAAAMRERGDGGVIVNVASILGMLASPEVPGAGYAASKGGLINLTRELASQWQRYGIRVNALAPGFFASEMTQELLAEGSQSRRRLEERTLLGRIGELHELDGPLLLLASEASSYMTGQVLTVDGGWTAI